MDAVLHKLELMQVAAKNAVDGALARITHHETEAAKERDLHVRETETLMAVEQAIRLLRPEVPAPSPQWVTNGIGYQGRDYRPEDHPYRPVDAVRDLIGDAQTSPAMTPKPFGWASDVKISREEARTAVDEALKSVATDLA